MSIDKDTRKIVVGARSVRRMFDRQLGRMIDISKERLGDGPLWVNEFGTPFNGSRGGDSWEDDSDETRALEAYFEALEGRGLSYALWQYEASSRQAGGDGWNHEEFSIWWRDLGVSGRGRALDAVVRPYFCAVQCSAGVGFLRALRSPHPGRWQGRILSF